MFPGAAVGPLVAASSAWRRLSVIASFYQGTQRPTRSCPSRRPGREQRVLCEAGGGEATIEALSSRQSLTGRAPSRSRSTSAAGFPERSCSETELGPGLLLLKPLVQRARFHYLELARQLSLSATHSSLPGGWASPGSNSTCTNHSVFLLCVDLSGAECVFRDFPAAPPPPDVCSDSGGEGAEQPPA